MMDPDLLLRLTPLAAGNQPEPISNVSAYTAALAQHLTELAVRIESSSSAPTLFHLCTEVLVVAAIAARDTGALVHDVLSEDARQQTQYMRGVTRAVYTLASLAQEQSRILTQGSTVAKKTAEASVQSESVLHTGDRVPRYESYRVVP